jgi:hypothetical protein
MSQFIDWSAVIGEFSPTKLTIGLGFYIIVRVIIYVLKKAAKLFRGWLLSSERRAILYIHLKKGHAAHISQCIAADCNKLHA